MNRDAIDSKMEPVGSHEAGKHYRLGILDVVVLNGTFKEMGRQYGTLMKDKILSIRDELVKQYIDPEILSYDEMKGLIGEPFYKVMPKRIKDIYAGISEATGIDAIELSTLDHQTMVVMLSRRTGQTAMCTALAVWGSHTKGGTTYTGRNFDYAPYFRDMMPKWGQVVVMNPAGGDYYSVAGLGLAGTVSEFIDAMNSEGLYVEFNNGAGTIGATMYSNRTPTWSDVFLHLFEYSTIEELELHLNSSRANYPSINLAAEPRRGQVHEIGTDRYAAAVPEKKDLTCRGNQFLDPSWGIPDLPSPAAWYSRTRRESLTKLVLDQSPHVDEKAIMQAMNAELFDKDNDWKVNEVGHCVFEPPPTPGDVTVWQVVGDPAELKMWVRIPTHSGWMELDLKQLFTSG